MQAIKTKKRHGIKKAKVTHLPEPATVIPDEKIKTPFAARWSMRRHSGVGLKNWQVVCVSFHACREDAERMLAERNQRRGSLEYHMQECLPTDIDYPDRPDDVRETVKRRAAAKRSHAKWFADTFGG